MDVAMQKYCYCWNCNCLSNSEVLRKKHSLQFICKRCGEMNCEFNMPYANLRERIKFNYAYNRPERNYYLSC